jgi:hypothetical protein
VICKPLEIHAVMSKPTKVVTSATPPQGRHAPDRDLRHEGVGDHFDHREDEHCDDEGGARDGHHGQDCSGHDLADGVG